MFMIPRKLKDLARSKKAYARQESRIASYGLISTRIKPCHLELDGTKKTLSLDKWELNLKQKWLELYQSSAVYSTILY